MRIRFLFLIILQIISPKWTLALICSRFPSNTLTPKSPVDENFAILINNNPKTYVLGQEYNITINAYNGHRYVTFSLALENENGVFTMNEDLGQFKISDPIETRFSPNCINMVESTNTHPKTRSEITWIAPTDPNSGCVLIRATLLQHRDVWYMDDGGLTRRICPEFTDEVENQRVYDSQECCACDEARYELTFQGVWNRNLHPKDFPPKGWIARFADIVGAAHLADYRFWQDGELASDGMQEYAEHGSSRLLEKEFNSNFQQGVIRTIIKARGPSFPNLNGISIASVRVDPKHHLISLASKIEPSPDWFVGISGMELCMPNCTWLDERVVQLYPWDVGTDAGPSYTSADQPQVPPDVIRRMRSNYPNDPRSPFFDETGAAMAPFATLTVKRQRVYDRTCEDEDSNNDNVPRECHTHPWTKWSECSVSCGEGHSTRIRVYKQPELAKAYNCDAMVTLREDETCKGQNCYGPDAAAIDEEENFNDENDQRSPISAECKWQWTDWSECSKTCGEGRTIRRREFINIRTGEPCQTASNKKSQEMKVCHGTLCLGDVANNRRRGGGGYSENFNEDIENGREIGRPDNNNGAQYWNSADGINNNDRGIEEEDRNQFWRNDQRRTRQRGSAVVDGYYVDAEQLNENAERVNINGNGNGNGNGEDRYGYDNAEIVENENSNGFEVGNLRNGNMEANNGHGMANGMHRNADNQRVQQSNGNSNQQQQQKEYIPDRIVPSYCFDKLHIFNCLNTKVVRNSWFYNFCEDECMLFAETNCDRNENKFFSLEACESTCQRPENEAYLKYKQERTCSSTSSTDNRRVNKRRRKITSKLN